MPDERHSTRTNCLCFPFSPEISLLGDKCEDPSCRIAFVADCVSCVSLSALRNRPEEQSIALLVRPKLSYTRLKPLRRSQSPKTPFRIPGLRWRKALSLFLQLRMHHRSFCSPKTARLILADLREMAWLPVFSILGGQRFLRARRWYPRKRFGDDLFCRPSSFDLHLEK